MGPTSPDVVQLLGLEGRSINVCDGILKGRQSLRGPQTRTLVSELEAGFPTLFFRSLGVETASLFGAKLNRSCSLYYCIPPGITVLSAQAFYCLPKGITPPDIFGSVTRAVSARECLSLPDRNICHGVFFRGGMTLFTVFVGDTIWERDFSGGVGVVSGDT